MKHTVTQAEIKTWLQEKHHTDSFGLGDMKLTLTKLEDTKVHVLNQNQTKILCKTYMSNTLTHEIKTYIDLFFLKSKETCLECGSQLEENLSYMSGLVLTDYDWSLRKIAETCILLERTLEELPFRGWQGKLLDLRFELFKYLNNDVVTEAQNILHNTLKTILTKVETCLENNPNLLEDKEVQDLLSRSYFSIINKEHEKDLKILTALNISKDEPIGIKSKTKIKTWFKENQKGQLKEENPLLELNNLLANHNAYLQKIKDLKEAFTDEEKILLKIKYGLSTTEEMIRPELIQECIYLLKTTVKTPQAKGILFPAKLVKILDEKTDKSTMENLGMVKNTDTLKTLETALGLDLKAEKSLEAARLMLKK